MPECLRARYWHPENVWNYIVIRKEILMNKKDILELKRRLKKKSCTFTRLGGCYVNVDKEILLNFNENFLNLEEEELYKYLEIAGKVLSGTHGNNLLELEFPNEEEVPGGRQQSLMVLKESKLKNEELLNTFYRLIIDHYDYSGNYLILVYHDAYDVMKHTSDKNALDESEEVYEYLLCAVCPVTLSKAGLGYLETENRIGPRVRDWVVGVPDTGFIFPAFTDRSTDIHAVMYYTRDVKEPHREFMEDILGCPAKLTAAEQKNTFHSIVTAAIPDEHKQEKVFMDIQETLNDIVEEQAILSERGQEPEPIVLTAASIQDMLASTGISEEIAAKIESSYSEKFGDMPPIVDHLLDNKLLAAGQQKKKEQELMVEVQQLKDQLETARAEHTNINAMVEFATAESAVYEDNSIMGDGDTKNSDITADCPVILTVAPEKAEQITSQTIDGHRYLLIPMEENEQIRVNGITESY